MRNLKRKCLTLLNFAAETGFVIKQSEANRRMKWCTLSVFSKTVICYTRFAEVIDLPTLESLPDAFYCRAKDLCKLYASSSFFFFMFCYFGSFNNLILNERKYAVNMLKFSLFFLSAINVIQACSAIARYNQLYISHVQKRVSWRFCLRCINGLGVTAMQDGCSLHTHYPGI